MCCAVRIPSMFVMDCGHPGRISAGRVRGTVLVAVGDIVNATACFEAFVPGGFSRFTPPLTNIHAQRQCSTDAQSGDGSW